MSILYKTTFTFQSLQNLLEVLLLPVQLVRVCKLSTALGEAHFSSFEHTTLYV